jgi:hypothetical protein
VVSYGFSVGHLRANNSAFERFGLAEVARSAHELESVLRHVTRERHAPSTTFASLPSIASKTLEARPRVRPQAVWHLRVNRLATAGLMTVIATILIIAVAASVNWDTPYRVIAKPIERRLHIGKQATAPQPADQAEDEPATR